MKPKFCLSSSAALLAGAVGFGKTPEHIPDVHIPQVYDNNNLAPFYQLTTSLQAEPQLLPLLSGKSKRRVEPEKRTQDHLLLWVSSPLGWSRYRGDRPFRPLKTINEKSAEIKKEIGIKRQRRN